MGGSGTVRRFHLFEIADLEACPSSLRRAMRDAMVMGQAEFTTFQDLVGPLVDALKRTGSTEVLDLCSGAGGPWHHLAEALSDAGVDVDVRLSEIASFPRQDLALPVSPRGSVTYLREPIDARSVPEHRTGLRTVFNALHHLRPHEVGELFAQTQAAREGIVVAELTSRRVSNMVWNVFAIPVAMTAAAAFSRNPRIMAWTGLGLALPIALAWDGWVSCLRSYSTDELLALGRNHAPDFEWSSGSYRIGALPVWVSYVIGLPRSGEGTATLEQLPEAPLTRAVHAAR